VATSDDGPRFAQVTDLQREDQERRQSLWRTLLLIALGLFIAETVVSNWASRKATGAPTAVMG